MHKYLDDQKRNQTNPYKFKIRIFNLFKPPDYIIKETKVQSKE